MLLLAAQQEDRLIFGVTLTVQCEGAAIERDWWLR